MSTLMSTKTLSLFAVPALLLASTGCMVYSDTTEVVHTDYVGQTVYNYPPSVRSAEAGVYWDDYYYDDIWYFEAYVDDRDGPLDVAAVWADVWDPYYGDIVASFELFPTADPYFWESAWYGSTVPLDPFFRGYEVDIIAYDTFEDFDILTIWPYTY